MDEQHEPPWSVYSWALLTADRFPPNASTGESGQVWAVVYNGVPQPVALRLGLDDAGRLACTGLYLGLRLATSRREPTISPHVPVVDSGDHRLTARALREIPLGDILDALGHEALARARDDRTGGARTLRKIMGAVPAVDPISERRPGRRGHGSDFYERFADTYAATKRQSARSPIAALSKSYGVDASTLYRWLRHPVVVERLRGDQT